MADVTVGLECPERGRAGTIALAASAGVSLLLGVLVYLVDRDWGTVLFLEPLADRQPALAGVFGPSAPWLPSLFHAYGFALLIILMLRPRPRASVYGAFGWFLIAAIMEWLQSAPAERLILATHRLLTEGPLPGPVQAYVVYGRFDVGDLLATALGCLAAGVAALIVEVSR
jgi:hypothetical protein